MASRTGFVYDVNTFEKLAVLNMEKVKKVGDFVMMVKHFINLMVQKKYGS